MSLKGLSMNSTVSQGPTTSSSFSFFFNLRKKRKEEKTCFFLTIMKLWDSVFGVC